MSAVDSSRVVPPPSASGELALPSEFGVRRLVRRGLQAIAIVGLLVLVAALAPGLDEVRDELGGAAVGWLLVAVALEALSCVSYVVMFRPVFCRRMSWRSSWDIGMSELAVGSILPASGAGGLALGAWVLSRAGMPADRIASRTVAFFVIKSGVNFVAVVVIGVIVGLGLWGPHQSPWLTWLPAVGAALVLALVVALPRIGPGPTPGPSASRSRRMLSAGRRATIDGTGDALALIRGGDLLLLGGAVGYWAFDNAVLWATFSAIGDAPAIPVILLGYLIGQLGGALPLPGGIGGMDGGLIGAMVAFGAPLALTVGAVLAYRLILFWLPLIIGGAAFVSLRRGMNRPERPDLCADGA
ncbi:hypothetical protein PAI11_26630 [Patulibacter medicamentivorans]|uniref:Integral membrane protein n=1 Tax=Patulibacter medicamentivorans TaxID=1097667 RepID=H0E761_9ACTN|nr:YbhN family protein [Patulibacter medicamentivorans]EHN10478.1 hypothetical protein PAI11_26630 [Patulibacter medicamentivorans]